MYYRHLALFMFAFLFLFNPTFSPNQVMAMPKASAMINVPTVTGTVLETMNASGYTYILVQTGTGETWVAIPATTIEKGAAVTYYEGMVMKNFTSKTLNRTFDAVVFSSGLVDQDGSAAQIPQAPTPPVASDSFAAAVKAEKSTGKAPAKMELSAGSAGAIAPLEEIAIEKAPAANGYTVKEVFEKNKELAGKKLQVHGKVVKFSPMIMGKNWIHLQDGTGDPMHNSHDLVVTTGDTVDVGNIITIEGTLAAEKDFGAGYKYTAIIEDAAIIQ